MGLIKSLPPRATKQSDANIVAKASKVQKVSPTIRGKGGGTYDSISAIVSVVSTKLGKYKDQYELLREERSVREYFDAIISNGIGALDTETDSLDPILCTLAGVPIYTPGQRPAYIPLNHVSYITGVKTSEQVDESVVAECLKKCEDAGVKWLFHNAKYDIRVVKNKLGVKLTPYWDTYLAARCINQTERSYELKELHLKYCKSSDSEAYTYSKLFEGVPFTQVPITTAYLYAAGDAKKTYELYEYQKTCLTRRKLPGPYYVFRNIEMPLVSVVVDMEDTGIRLDTEYAKQLSEKYHKILEERVQEYYKVLEMYRPEIEAYKKENPNHGLEDPINPNSPKQLATFFYDICKLKSPNKDKPKGTGEDILIALKHPLSSAILNIRETVKLLNTYIDKLPELVNPKTNRLHCNYNQYGADTGRFSSSDPNLQNIPSQNKEIRKMFSASEGYYLISVDFKQQEPRTLAHVSGDTALIDAYKAGKDIYAWIASFIYNVPYEECMEFRADGTKNPQGKKRRDSVKSIILGIMYGRGVSSIAEQLGCSKKEAQEIINKFYNAFPMVKVFMDNTIAKARKVGYVETIWGRRRGLPDIQLEPYEFKYIEGKAATFDPLAFDSPSISYEVDDATKAYYLNKLEKAWRSEDRRKVIEEAYNKGIRIRDNGGFIAEAERQCINTIIQGSSADMSKLAMIKIHNDPQLREWGYRMLIPVHDEIIGEAPEQYAAQCAERVAALMVEAASERVTVPMACDIEITKVWYGDPVVA